MYEFHQTITSTKKKLKINKKSIKHWNRRSGVKNNVGNYQTHPRKPQSHLSAKVYCLEHGVHFAHGTLAARHKFTLGERFTLGGFSYTPQQQMSDCVK